MNRQVDALDRLVSGYNSAVHSGTWMASSLVRNKDVLQKWERTRKRHARLKRGRGPVYSVGQDVRIVKEKRRLAKGFSWTLDMFRISKVVRRLLG